MIKIKKGGWGVLTLAHLLCKLFFSLHRHCFAARPLRARTRRHCSPAKILLNLAENTDLYLWLEKKERHHRRRDTLRPHNVIAAIAAGRIVLVCKAVAPPPHNRAAFNPRLQ